jgi:predicted MPP superfamily phosphohydrolase
MSQISMDGIVQRLDVWAQAGSLLNAGGSLLLHAPRHYGKRRLTREILKDFVAGSSGTCVYVRIDDVIAGGKLDYSKLWDVTRRQAGLTGRPMVRDRTSYAIALRRVVRERMAPLAFVVTSGGAGAEAHQFDIVSILHEFRDEPPLEFLPKLRILVLDDYSLYYYETVRKELSSKWDFQRLHQRPLGAHDIQSLISRDDRATALNARETEAISNALLNLTGGHLGLILELLDHVGLMKVDLNVEYCQGEARELLQKSNILEAIRKALGQDAGGLTDVALQYGGGKVPHLDYSSPNLQFLRQLGVVQWVSAVRAELCPGLIGDLVSELHKAAAETRPLGMLVSELGPRLYDKRSEKLVADENDFVVVHLSDIHIGESYPFRLSRRVSGRQEDGKRSAAQMLAADLRSLGLEGRIDLVVISGDFTDEAGMDEFNRAREIVEETLSSVGVDLSRLVVTAGNHDVQWRTSGLAQIAAVSGASRENYETFRELLGFKRTGDVELKSVVSRGGRRLLRVLSVDSNFVEGPSAAGIGFVSEDSFSAGERLLKQEQTAGIEDCWTWLVLHHHVFPASSLSIEEIKRPKLTVLGNASDVLAFASRVNAELILHGHEHQPSVTVARRWPCAPSPDFQPIVAIGAGSFSAPRAALGPFSRNQYFIIYRKRDHVVIRSRSSSDAGLAFAAHNDLVVPLPRNGKG